MCTWTDSILTVRNISVLVNMIIVRVLNEHLNLMEKEIRDFIACNSYVFVLFKTSFKEMCICFFNSTITQYFNAMFQDCELMSTLCDIYMSLYHNNVLTN